jgi:hypothetical protein
VRIEGRALLVGATGLVLFTCGWSIGTGTAQAQTVPTLKVDPAAGTVGTTVRIAGRGFCGSPACSSVQLSFAGIVVADGIKVGSDNGFALSVTVPGGIPPGEKAVAATQTNASGQQRVAIATFQVTLGVPSGSTSPTATASPTGTATPSPTGSATSPSAATVIGSPAAGGGGSSRGLTWAMVVAVAVFLGALLGMGYVLWRSRQVPPPPLPQVGPIAPYEDVVAALTPHGQAEGGGQPPPSPGPPEPSGPSEGSGEGQTTG